MSRQRIYTFYVEGMDTQSIAVNVFITNLPPNTTATVLSTVEYGCDWFIVYSVVFGDGQTEFFYEQVQDSNESNDYVLNISYDSTRAICSFDSSEQIIFVNSNNEMLLQQNQQMLYEYIVNEKFKLFLVIFKNNILLFWHDDSAQVVVKTLNLSSFDSFEGLDFTRVDTIIDLSCGFHLTFYTESSCYNRYNSLYLSSESIIDSNVVCYVFKEHEFDIPCNSSFSGSQFQPDTDYEIESGVLRMDCHVDGESQESDSEADSDEDDY